MFKRRMFWILLFTIAWLVPMMQLLGSMEAALFDSSWILKACFLIFSAWYFPPAAVFGERFFVIGIGAGPVGTTGVYIAIAFYSIAIIALYAAVSKVRERARRQSSE